MICAISLERFLIPISPPLLHSHRDQRAMIPKAATTTIKNREKHHGSLKPHGSKYDDSCNPGLRVLWRL